MSSERLCVCLHVQECAYAHLFAHTLCTHMHVRLSGGGKAEDKWEVIKKKFIWRAREAGNYCSPWKLNPIPVSARNGQASQPRLLVLFELSPYFYLIASLIFLGNNYKTNFSNKIKLLLCSLHRRLQNRLGRVPRSFVPEHWIRKTVLTPALVLTSRTVTSHGRSFSLPQFPVCLSPSTQALCMWGWGKWGMGEA